MLIAFDVELSKNTGIQTLLNITKAVTHGVDGSATFLVMIFLIGLVIIYHGKWWYAFGASVAGKLFTLWVTLALVVAIVLGVARRIQI